MKFGFGIAQTDCKGEFLYVNNNEHMFGRIISKKIQIFFFFEITGYKTKIRIKLY